MGFVPGVRYLSVFLVVLSALATSAHSSPDLSKSAAPQPSGTVLALAAWTRNSSDNQNKDFVVVDKINAQIFVFNAEGEIYDRSPVLLGLARGDESVPGIGKRKLSEIRPQERTTAAGRFIGERGLNLSREDVVWIDYDAGLAIHRVRPTSPRDRRLERLASAAAADKRVSYGCVVVPVKFFENVIAPIFSKGKAMVYVLPELQPASTLFGFEESQASEDATNL